jgi:hypothetical protein
MLYTVPIPLNAFSLYIHLRRNRRYRYDLDADLATSALGSVKYIIELYVRYIGLDYLIICFRLDDVRRVCLLMRLDYSIHLGGDYSSL